MTCVVFLLFQGRAFLHLLYLTSTNIWNSTFFPLLFVRLFVCLLVCFKSFRGSFLTLKVRWSLLQGSCFPVCPRRLVHFLARAVLKLRQCTVCQLGRDWKNLTILLAVNTTTPGPTGLFSSKSQAVGSCFQDWKVIQNYWKPVKRKDTTN